MGGYAFYVYPFYSVLLEKIKKPALPVPAPVQTKNRLFIRREGDSLEPLPPVFQSYITALAVYFRNHIGVWSQIVTVKLWLQDRFFMLLVAIIGDSFE